MKKPKNLDIGAAVRTIARERLGQPKSQRVVPDRRKKQRDRITKQETETMLANEK